MLKIDFGSGYNQKYNFKSCDITYSPFLDYVYDRQSNKIIGCEENTVSVFHMRHVLHHIPNLNDVCSMLNKYLVNGGYVYIEEVRKENFDTNYFLDCLWYRFVNIINDIWFSSTYRDYKSIMKLNGFELVKEYYHGTKECSIWKLI